MKNCNKLSILNRLPVFEPRPLQDFDAQWQETLEKVKAFRERYNKLPSPYSDNTQEKKLGVWCSSQKMAHRGIKDGYRTSPKRTKALESIQGWKWGGGIFDDRWQESFRRIGAFQKKHSRLPFQHSSDSEENKLAAWCSNQRQAYTGRSKGRMTSGRIKLLESIDGWYWEDDVGSKWQENFKSVSKFIDRSGRFPSAKSKNLKEKSLGGWCCNQRSAYRGNGRGAMTLGKIKALENISGWFWKDDKAGRWQSTCEQVKEFQKGQGKLPSYRSRGQKEKRLGNWCNNQKLAYKMDRMIPERIKSLVAIPGWYWTYKERK